jgi:hypothetical protein
VPARNPLTRHWLPIPAHLRRGHAVPALWEWSPESGAVRRRRGAVARPNRIGNAEAVRLRWWRGAERVCVFAGCGSLALLALQAADWIRMPSEPPSGLVYLHPGPARLDALGWRFSGRRVVRVAEHLTALGEAAWDATELPEQAASAVTLARVRQRPAERRPAMSADVFDRLTHDARLWLPAGALPDRPVPEIGETPK